MDRDTHIDQLLKEFSEQYTLDEVLDIIEKFSKTTQVA